MRNCMYAFSPWLSQTTPIIPLPEGSSSLLTLTHPLWKCYFFQRSHPWTSLVDSRLPTWHPLAISPFCLGISSSKNAILKSSRANSEEPKPILVILPPCPAFRCGHGTQSGLMTGQTRAAGSCHELLRRDTLCYCWALSGFSVAPEAAAAILGPPRGGGRPRDRAGELEQPEPTLTALRCWIYQPEPLNLGTSSHMKQ